MKNLKELLIKNKFLVLSILAAVVFFYPFFLQGKIPIPADTILGLYHPWRDNVWDGKATGVPFKNYLITDPVRQQYVWRNLAVSQLLKGSLPLWNPYSFAGTPLLANFQTAAFYPLNFLYFFLPFNFSWGLQVMFQPLLAGIFMYLYLRHLKISEPGSFIGSFVYSYSGFSIAWLEWNTILHTALWLPLILLSVDKIIQHFNNSPKFNKLLFWLFIFIFSSISSFFAGHLQIFFYSFLVIIGYTFIRVLFLQKNKLKVSLLFVICFLLFTLITSIQWFPAIQLITHSARDVDQGNFQKAGWFIPWQNLVQFIAPDFFGNPATNNYYGIWNYGEFIGYIGIIPIFLSIYALLFRRDKKTILFGVLSLTSLIFALPTPLAKLPYQLQIPFISTSQPTRLIFIIDFALSILAALGFDYFIKSKNLKKTLVVLIPLTLIFFILWIFITFPHIFQSLISNENLLTARKNLILPTAIFVGGAILFIISNINKKVWINTLFVICYLLFVIFDLFRFGWKFTPFVVSDWIFPETSITNLLKQDEGQARVLALDSRILPPNFSAQYHLQDAAGYDPLYLMSYNKLVSAWNDNKPDLTPSSFNRIVTPTNIDSFITNLLGIKYILSFGTQNNPKYNLITNAGNTYLYDNPKAFPRVFFVESVVEVNNDQEVINKMFELKDDLKTIAVVSKKLSLVSKKLLEQEKVEIKSYLENDIKLETFSEVKRLLVLTDIYYPTWKVYIDGGQAEIISVDYLFRSVIVPDGKHIIEFRNTFI